MRNLINLVNVSRFFVAVSIHECEVLYYKNTIIAYRIGTDHAARVERRASSDIPPVVTLFVDKWLSGQQAEELLQDRLRNDAENAIREQLNIPIPSPIQ